MSINTDTQQEQYDYKFKILVIGNLNVGIDSIIERYVNNNFPLEKKYTNSYDGKSKIILESSINKRILINVQDYPGRKFRPPNNSWYSNADGVIIVYDVTNRDSFNEIETTYIRDVNLLTDRDKTQIIIVGNKYDQILNNSQQLSIPIETINQYCLLNSFDHFFISALTYYNISVTFNHLISKIVSKIPPPLTLPQSHDKENKNKCIIS